MTIDTAPAQQQNQHAINITFKDAALVMKSRMTWLQYIRGFVDSLYWLTLGKYDNPVKHKAYSTLFRLL
jgi:hypothetical protein